MYEKNKFVSIHVVIDILIKHLVANYGYSINPCIEVFIKCTDQINNYISIRNSIIYYFVKFFSLCTEQNLLSQNCFQIEYSGSSLNVWFSIPAVVRHTFACFPLLDFFRFCFRIDFILFMVFMVEYVCRLRRHRYRQFRAPPVQNVFLPFLVRIFVPNFLCDFLSIIFFYYFVSFSCLFTWGNIYAAVVFFGIVWL